jgi:hypothetical protein
MYLHFLISLQSAEFDIKKEAAWAISNATSGGTAEQIRYLVDVGAVRPLCDLLTVPDVRIVTVALEGLENILKVRCFVFSVLMWYVVLCNCAYVVCGAVQLDVYDACCVAHRDSCTGGR